MALGWVCRKAAALAASVMAAWAAASSLRQVVPWRLSSFSQPTACCQRAMSVALGASFLKSWNW
ncbi:Uncharacterised protein [uncultured Comamonas sp.]|nr:Uncharacterised protein [uncultured Comamonas sp.]